MPIKLDLKSRFQRVLEKNNLVSGKLISRQLTYIVDAEILRIFHSQLKDKFPTLKDNFCILAIGGYGRMELVPHSDIDILYLHNDLSDQILIEVISEINTSLFDAGKVVGHSCRTIQECFENLDNINSFYAMIDSRFIVGSEKLFKEYQDSFLKKLPTETTEFYNSTKLKNLENIIQSKKPLLVAEPNLKHGALGLRDVQAIYWIEKSLNFIPSLSGLAMIPIFTRGEVRELESAYDFLLRARIGLHYLENHQSDRMGLTLQPELAEYLGFGPKGNLQSIESMMNTLYLHQKEILSFIGIYLDYKKQKTNSKNLTTNELNLVEENKFLYPPSIGNLFSNPETLYGDVLHIFYISHKLNLDLSQTLIAEIKFASNFLQEDFKNSPIAIDFFLKILRESKTPGKLLTDMHRCNVLGKFIPEFGACTNFSLFSYHHEYPVDEHSLFILRELDLLLLIQFGDNEVQEIFNKIDKVDILALAILLHDAGKVKQGDHCQYGSELAFAVGERLGLVEKDINLLRFLVEIHIHMSELTTKRDISDPKLISDFGNLMADENRLRLLYILTIIDTKSVGPNVLTNWKKANLHSLFIKTLDYLKNRNQIQSLNHTEQSLELLKIHLKQKENLSEDILNLILNFIKSLNPKQYVNYFTPRRIMQHFLYYIECQKKSDFESFIEFEREPSFVNITVYSKDNRFLLSDITGTVTAESLNVIGMRSFKKDSDFVITFIQLSDSYGSENIEEEKLEKLKQNLESVLSKKTDVEKLLESGGSWGSYHNIPYGMVEKKVEYNNIISDEYTVLDILLPDSLGLLYNLIKIILSNDLQLHYLRVSTSADYAYDSFYIKTLKGNKIEETVIQKKVESEILNLSNKVSEINYIEF